MNEDARIINAGHMKKTDQVSQRWKVYDPNGLAPTLCSMTSGGGYNIMPKIIMYEDICEHPSAESQDGVEMQTE